MVLLVERLRHPLKHFSKLENNHHHHHHHHQSEAITASLQAFRSDISNRLNRLPPEFLSLSWILHSLEMVSSVHRAFAKLTVDIDYPMSKWEGRSMEQYLNYSLKLLDFLNCISYSISHLGHDRLYLSHALSLVATSPQSAIERLEANKFKNHNKELKFGKLESGEERSCSGKELAIHQALMVMSNTEYWVFGIVLTGFSGDTTLYSEMKKAAQGFVFSSSLIALDSSFFKEAQEGKGLVLKELAEMNEEAAGLVAAIGIGKSSGARERLERKLEAVQKEMDDIEKEAYSMFSEILAGRNQLLHSLRHQK